MHVNSDAMIAARFSPFIIAALLLSSSVHAEPTAADKRNASTLVLEGRRLLNAGDAGAALAKFQAAHDLLRAPTTALDVATAYEALGQLVEARAMVYEITQLPAEPNEPFAFKQARDSAAAAIEALDSRIPALVLQIEGAPKEAVIATVDGEKVPAGSLTTLLARNPGKREVVATAPGYQTARATVELVEGESKPVEVKLVLEREAVPVKAPPPKPKDEPAPTRKKGGIYVGIAVSGAFAAAAVGTGIGAALADKKSKDDWNKANCSAMPTIACYSNFNEQENKRFVLGNTAFWMAIGAVAVGGGTLGYALLSDTPRDKSPKKAVSVSPTLGGVVVQGTF
jgi:hypothetical protein